MTNEEYSRIIAEIDSLPRGGITYKKINGKEYAYYQWREDGKQRSRRIMDEESEQLSGQIERRKELQKLIKDMDNQEAKEDKITSLFRCTVRIGDNLERFAKPVAKWLKRECYQQLHDYVYGDIQDKVYLLYGLRRTGKTTLIRQLIAEMDDSMRIKS